MRLNINDYREKVLGCWLGKNIGGTVGAPFEWKRQVNNITITAERLSKATNRAVLEITTAGRPTVMLVPVTLLNGNIVGRNT
ncbi:MAG: hypothetical protein ACOYOU_12305 [Kiritimatiellia bacterium]